MKNSNFYKNCDQIMDHAFCSIDTKNYESDKSYEHFTDRLDMHRKCVYVVGSDNPNKATSFALELVNNALKKNISTAFFACRDIIDVQVGTKLIARRSGIKLNSFYEGKISIEEFEKVKEARRSFCETSFFLNDDPLIGIDMLEFTIRTMVQEENIDFVVIDSLEYIQEYIASNTPIYNLPLIMKKLSQIADDNGIIILLLCKVSRSDYQECMLSSENIITSRYCETFVVIRNAFVRDKHPVYAEFVFPNEDYRSVAFGKYDPVKQCYILNGED